MKKFLFTTLAVGALAVSAHAVSANYAPGTGENNSKCYWISTVEDLDAFAAKVNGGDVSACAELTADIYYNTTQVVNDDLTDLANGIPANVWTPIGTNDKPFMGSFDGKGHTIYGLYLARAWEPAFVAKATGATIKNLDIRDSYFRALANGGDAGGFIGDIQVRSQAEAIQTTIEGCSFKGIVYAESGAVNAGGIVGSIGSTKVSRTYYGATLVLSNSYNEGSILGPGSDKKNGGLIGYVNNSAKATITSSYSVGTVENGNALVGAKDGKAGTVGGSNIGCIGNNCGANVNSGVVQASSKEQVMDALVDAMASDPAALNDFFEKNGSGVSFEEVTLPSGNKGIMAWLKPTKTGETAALSENDSIVIPADVTVDVDKIVLDREYKAGVYSTVIFPFTIEAKSVTNANFYEFAGVDQEKEIWEVNLTPMCKDTDGDGAYSVSDCGDADSIYANHPYIVKMTGDNDAALTFATSDQRGNSKLTIRKTVGVDLNKTVGNWSLVGVYGFTHWETSPGNVFGYSSKNPELYPDGRFVKAGDNVSVKAMRAYLYYNRPAVTPKPALMKSAAEEVLPSQLKVCIRPYVEPEIIVETIDPAVGDSEENSTLSIAKPMTAPETVKANRWYDLNGRRLNKKPANHGSFYNKSIIVK